MCKRPPTVRRQQLPYRNIRDYSERMICDVTLTTRIAQAFLAEALIHARRSLSASRSLRANTGPHSRKHSMQSSHYSHLQFRGVVFHVVILCLCHTRRQQLLPPASSRSPSIATNDNRHESTTSITVRRADSFSRSVSTTATRRRRYVLGLSHVLTGADKRMGRQAKDRFMQHHVVVSECCRSLSVAHEIAEP
jgi:hypothetical protein